MPRSIDELTGDQIFWVMMILKLIAAESARRCRCKHVMLNFSCLVTYKETSLTHASFYEILASENFCFDIQYYPQKLDTTSDTHALSLKMTDITTSAATTPVSNQGMQ